MSWPFPHEDEYTDRWDYPDLKVRNEIMFERFTERARQVVVLAQDEARDMHHGYIGPDHILLGLLREEEGLAAKVLARLGVSYDAVRTTVEYTGGYGDVGKYQSQIPFTPRGKKALELALREALSLGHNYIGTEHVLLGLVREGTDLLNTEEVRDETLRMLSGPKRIKQIGDAETVMFRPTMDVALDEDTERKYRRPRNGERRGGAGFPKFFKMIRPNDESGVSGTGWIMSGVQWPNGWVQTFWNTKDKPSSVGFYESFDAFMSIHVSSHPGNKTIIEWYDVDTTGGYESPR